MFRSRMFLACLVALTMLPLVGCGSLRCCRNSSSYSARPVYAAPSCNSCSTSAAPPVIYGN